MYVNKAKVIKIQFLILITKYIKIISLKMRIQQKEHNFISQSFGERAETFTPKNHN